jgi:hypothetical protein
MPNITLKMKGVKKPESVIDSAVSATEAVVKKSGSKLQKLSEEAKTKLLEHGKYHNKKHLASMRMNMMRGVSFDEAHEKAVAKFGGAGLYSGVEGGNLLKSIGKVVKKMPIVKKAKKASKSPKGLAKVVLETAIDDTPVSLVVPEGESDKLVEVITKKSKGGGILKTIRKIGKTAGKPYEVIGKANPFELGYEGGYKLAEAIDKGTSKGGIIEGDIKPRRGKKFSEKIGAKMQGGMMMEGSGHLDMKNPFSVKQLSPTQVRNLKKGRKVRVQDGNDIDLMLDEKQMMRILKTFKKGKGATIQMSPETIMENKKIEGKGIFGKQFDREVKKTLGNTTAKTLYKVADAAKPLVKKGMMAAAVSVPTLLGNPELIPVAMIAAKTAGMYMDKPSDYQKNPEKLALAATQASLDELADIDVDLVGDGKKKPKKSTEPKKAVETRSMSAPPSLAEGAPTFEKSLENFIRIYGIEELQRLTDKAKSATGSVRTNENASFVGNGIYAAPRVGGGLFSGAGLFSGSGIYASVGRGLGSGDGNYPNALLGLGHPALN